MRSAMVVGIAIFASACANTKPEINTMSVAQYVDGAVAEVSIEKRNAALHANALVPNTANMVRVYPDLPKSDLQQIVNANWNGTLDDITRRAAKLTGYSIRASGERSGSPIFVSVNGNGRPLLSLLEEAFGQGKGRARLEINQSQRLMTIHYKRPERSPVPHLDDNLL